jgi:hypothetical protein
VAGAGLARGCAIRDQLKAQPTLEAAGHEIVYPYLQPEIVALGLDALEAWEMDEPKAPLKRCLASHVPPEMVYRPKKGFTDPTGAVFRSPAFIEQLAATADDSAPLGTMLHRHEVLRLCRLLSRGRDLPDQVLNTLWGVVFTDRWYRTAERDAA